MARGRRLMKTGYSAVTLRNRLRDMVDEVEAMIEDGRIEDKEGGHGFYVDLSGALETLEELFAAYKKKRKIRA